MIKLLLIRYEVANSLDRICMRLYHRIVSFANLFHSRKISGYGFIFGEFYLKASFLHLSDILLLVSLLSPFLFLDAPFFMSQKSLCFDNPVIHLNSSGQSIVHNQNLWPLSPHDFLQVIKVFEILLCVVHGYILSMPAHGNVGGMFIKMP